MMAGDTSTAPRCNPHCEASWPNRDSNPWVARLLTASYGASTLADLLIADDAIATEREHADPAELATLPIPYSVNTSSGMWMALRVCLNEIEHVAEALENKRIVI